MPGSTNPNKQNQSKGIPWEKGEEKMYAEVGLGCEETDNKSEVNAFQT